ncbi:MAG: ATPase [Akkermansiaceae bacterium]|nr:ATPase [Armatimonadota bacterium]
MAEIVIGIDGGGTYTRAVVTDLSGRVLATVRAGAASPNKTVHARENVQGAIRDVVSQAGHTLADVAGLVAGMAGLDSPGDQEWAITFTELPGLNCPRLHVNDAVVAHAGALRSLPGIIAISGTGSIVFGVTESGRYLRNYDFHHYASSAARHLSYDAVYRILAGSTQPEDDAFVAQILTYWHAANLTELHERGTAGFVADNNERTRLFGEMAPLVSTAALNGVPLARAVCDAAIDALGVGIRLVGNGFAGETVSVALIGSVVNSGYMKRGVRHTLTASTAKRYHIIDAAFPAEIGAILMALTRYGVPIDDAIIGALKEYRVTTENTLEDKDEP